jgi:hypothetical protein
VDRLASLRLSIHPGAQARPVDEGIPFLGFTVFPWRRRLKRRKAIHFHRRLRGLLAQSGNEQARDRLAAMVRGWVNHASYGNTTGLRKRVLDGVAVD